MSLDSVTGDRLVGDGMTIHSAPPYSLWQLVRYMLALGSWGFGGPVALVGYMHRDLVERRAWITEADYKEGMTLAQLMPGPLAAQLAIYTACTVPRWQAWPLSFRLS
jgi:chromate transport protein ChrA